jgi:hypothetical protein
MKNIFKDASGKIVLTQKPNLPIIVWIFSKLATFLPLDSFVIDFFALVAFGSLFTWAWLEIFDGVNIFRRILGSIVMLVLLTSKLWM